MFPVEVWEQILANVEAPYLVKLQRVCHTWKSIITKNLQETNAWYRHCEKTISKKYWLILLENTVYLSMLTFCRDVDDDQVSEENQKNYKIWITLFRNWVKFCNIEENETEVIEFFKPIPKHRPTEHITCTAVLGELVAVGSTEGFINVFNIRSRQLVFRVDQYEEVRDLKLTVQGKYYEKIILLSTSILGKTRIWDIISQKRLFYSSGDIICAGYGYYVSTASKDKLYVYDAVEEKNYPIILSIPNYNLNSHIKTWQNSIKYVDMVVYNNQLYFLSDNGLYCELDLKEIEQTHKVSYVPSIKFIGVPKNQKIVKYYLFNPNVVFCITERGHLGVSVNSSKWYIYNVFPYLEGTVTAVFFNLRILVFGLDLGDVCIYFVENELGLKNINFESKKFKRIAVSSDPIVSVKIIELLDDQKLLVATKNTTYYINFN